MTARDRVVQAALDEIVPLRSDEPYDWPAVLDRTVERADSGRRRRIRFPRPLSAALVPLAAAVIVAVPLALAASQGWWFDRTDGPAHGSVVEIAHGTWSGRPWTMTAQLTAASELCFAVTPDGQANAEGQGAGMACTPLAALTRSGPGRRIGYLAGYSEDFPDFVAGAVVPTAKHVTIALSSGATTTNVLPAPQGLGANVGFFATQLPCGAELSRIAASNSAGATVAEVDVGKGPAHSRRPC